MIRPEQIPDEVVEAARIALETCNGGQQFFLNEVAPAIAAAIRALKEQRHE